MLFGSCGSQTDPPSAKVATHCMGVNWRPTVALQNKKLIGQKKVGERCVWKLLVFFPSLSLTLGSGDPLKVGRVPVHELPDDVDLIQRLAHGILVGRVAVHEGRPELTDTGTANP